MKAILITGGAGFIGRHTAIALRKKGYYVIGMGHPPRDGVNIKKVYDKWIEGDINQSNLKKVKIDLLAIIHCAGGSSVKESVINPKHDSNNNMDMLIDIMGYIIKRGNISRLIYISSAAVYGNGGKGSCKTTDKLDPISPYGEHKREGEAALEFLSGAYDLRASIIRFFSIYGEGLQKRLFWDIYRKLTAKGSIVKFDGTGREKRDWIHIDDAVNMIIKELNQTKKFKISNGGTGLGTTNAQLITYFREVIKNGKTLVFTGNVRPYDPISLVADTQCSNPLKKRLKQKLQQGIFKYIKSFQK